MAKFSNCDIAELAHQLTLSPRRLRMEQIRGIEQTLGLIDADRTYPFDFVCFRITKYHKRRSDTGFSIPGQVLIDDLVTMAEMISRKANLSVSELGGAFKTHQEVADDLKVSTKTIRRWRCRGLMGLRVVFEDGVNRLAFLQSTIDDFASRNKSLVQRGSSFTQLSADERSRMVDRARELLSDKPLKLHAAAKVIAEETNRAVETVRYTLRRYDENNPKTALFSRKGRSTGCPRHEAMWRCHQAGESNSSIARAFSCSTEETEQILHQVQVRLWADATWEFISDELFDAPNANAIILDAPEPTKPDAAPQRLPKGLPPYLQALYRTPLLTREQEHDLFRRYNYTKYKVAKAIKALDLEELAEEDYQGLKKLTDSVATLKQRIIQANLRLVVSIARKHVGWSPQFFEVISDGNISLMRAVEKFDYQRGTKFSTYSTWAVVKNYARSIPEQHYRNARYVTGKEEVLDSAPERDTSKVNKSDRQRVRELIASGISELGEREREIVSSHFGLGSSGGTLTLEQIGKRFGVTKERVRQIEQRALARLREVLSPSLIDALTD